MCDQDTVRIPLVARDGSVTAYTTVDAADAPFVQQWRWLLRKDGYAARVEWVNGRHVTIRLHRALLGLTAGDGLATDHINRDRLDNRRSNLRVATRRENCQNTPSKQGTTSRYRGVHWSKTSQKWLARVTANGKEHYLGYFTDEAEAAEAARVARLRLLPYAVD